MISFVESTSMRLRVVLTNTTEYLFLSSSNAPNFNFFNSLILDIS